jgi:serine phosphatase RsbU (regulator of sigma subunit)
MSKRILFALLFITVRLFGQTNATIDSLQNLVKIEKNESKKITLYNQLAFEYRSIDPEQTRAYGNHALQLAVKSKDVHGESDALHKVGLSYYYLDVYDSALWYYRASLDLAEKSGDSLLIAQANLAIGNVFRLQGLNDTAVVYLTSALHLYESANDQKNIAFCLSTIGDTYLFEGEFTKALEYHTKALELSKKIGDLHREAFCYSSIGNNYHMRGDFNSSIVYHTKSIEAARKVNEENIIAGSMGTIADAHANLFNYPKAIETYLQALDLAEKKKDKHNTAFIYAGMSDIYQRQNDLDKAEQYQRMSIKLSKDIGDYSRSCDGELTMAAILIQKGDTAQARAITEDALKVAWENNYPFHLAWGYRIKGKLKELSGDLNGAVDYYRQSLKINEELGDQKETADTKNHLARALYQLGNIDEAIELAKSSLLLARTIHSPGLAHEAAKILCDAYEKKGDFKLAFSYSQLVRQLSDSLNNAESAKRQTEIFLQHRFDKEKEEARIERAKSDAFQEARYQQQRLILIVAFAGLILLAGLVFLIFRGYRQKQKANEIISEQKKMVEEVNREITDSINYAKNIQEAMLPAPDSIGSIFSEHFIFFRPRDIVSGDFYWVGKQGSRKYFAVADCTGHGVPGGFMSMLGITLLTEILEVRNILSPEQMLDEMRTQVVQSLNKERRAGETFKRDGMDIALCCIDTSEKKLWFSGANNGIYIVRNNELIEVNADKQPVGAHENEKPFTLQSVQLQPDDLVCAYTDGFPDQFGGEKGKKLMYSRFRSMILKCASLENEKRSKFLSDEFDKWKLSHAQIDDVCVMGVRV